jgi:hypothetical protein
VGFTAAEAAAGVGAGSPYILPSRLVAQAASGAGPAVDAGGAAAIRGGGKLAQPLAPAASINRRSTLLSRIWHIRDNKTAGLTPDYG